MRRILSGSVAALAVLMLGACGDGGTGTDNDEDPTTGTVSGEVRTSGGPVAGAQVSLSGIANTTTTAGGTYEFLEVEPGAYTVTLTVPDELELDDGDSANRSVMVTAGATATASWTLVDPDAPPVQNVTLSGTTFSPAHVTIEPGTLVRWTVNDGSHTVTPEDSEQPGVWTEAALSTGQTFEHLFETPDEVYDYFCVPHQSVGMTGSVTVTSGQ